jgi:hypothetical protein
VVFKLKSGTADAVPAVAVPTALLLIHYVWFTRVGNTLWLYAVMLHFPEVKLNVYIFTP